jgi:hypothetical protein
LPDEQNPLRADATFFTVDRWVKGIGSVIGVNPTSTEAVAHMLRGVDEPLRLESLLPQNWHKRVKNAVQQYVVAVFPLDDNATKSTDMARIDSTPLAIWGWLRAGSAYDDIGDTSCGKRIQRWLRDAMRWSSWWRFWI